MAASTELEMTCSQRPASWWASAHERPRMSVRKRSARRCRRTTCSARFRPRVASLILPLAVVTRPSCSIRLIISDTAGRETWRRSAMRAWITSTSSSWSSKIASQYSSNAGWYSPGVMGRSVPVGCHGVAVLLVTLRARTAEARTRTVVVPARGRSVVHVGYSVTFQNPFDARPDGEVYADELRLVQLADRPGLRLRVDGRAPLHRLHDVPRSAAAALLAGGPHRARPPRHRCGRAAVARSGARRRADRAPRQPLRWPAAARHRAGHRPHRVRGLRRRHGHVARALRGVGRGGAGCAGTGVDRGRRGAAADPSARPAAPARAVVPRPHVCRRRLARLDADHGSARRRHPDHPAEAVAGGRAGLRHLQRGVPGRERGARAGAAVQRLHLRRRRRRPGRGAGPPLHRRVLPVGAAPLRVRVGARTPG